MDLDTLAARVRAMADDFNAGDPDAVRRHLATEFYTHVPGPDEIAAVEVWNELAADLRHGLPDLRISIERLDPSEDGQRLTGHVVITGTHRGPLWGAPPTGASLTWETDVSVRPVGDRFAVNFDGFAAPTLLGMLRQVQVVNPPDRMDQPPRHPNAQVPEFLLRMAFTGQVADRPCDHLAEIREWSPATRACASCQASGDVWPALRMCMLCGFVGCCDTSKNTHMKHHVEESGHALMRSVHGEEGWMWCYADNAFRDSRTRQRLRARQGAV